MEEANEGEEAQACNDAQDEDLQRALTRKVAQLTKVVLHLTSRNNESEQLYEKHSAALEEKVGDILEKAAHEMSAGRLKVKDMAQKSSLQEDAERLEALFQKQREALGLELQQLRKAFAERRLEAAELSLSKQISSVTTLSADLRQQLQALRLCQAQNVQEAERKLEMLRQERRVELEGLKEVGDRRAI